MSFTATTQAPAALTSLLAMEYVHTARSSPALWLGSCLALKDELGQSDFLSWELRST